jgi:hypothetical protein
VLDKLFPTFNEILGSRANGRDKAVTTNGASEDSTLQQLRGHPPADGAAAHKPGATWEAARPTKWRYLPAQASCSGVFDAAAMPLALMSSHAPLIDGTSSVRGIGFAWLPKRGSGSGPTCPSRRPTGSATLRRAAVENRAGRNHGTRPRRTPRSGGALRRRCSGLG